MRSSSPGRSRVRVLLLLGWALLPLVGASPLRATGSPPTGRLIEGIAVEADPGYSYTLYLPSDYSAERRWPLLFVMDPRGRGTAAARVFAEGAERYGFVLVSSNDTASDGDLLPNEQAISATLPELTERYGTRPGDLYLTGMSGTSRIAWLAGHLMRGAIGGVVGTAAATTGRDLGPGPETPFAWFGVAAQLDFNYREMLETHHALSAAGATSRLAFTAEGHSWPPPEIAAQALGWMRLVAFRAGRLEMSPNQIDSLLASMRDTASAHESAGRALDALETRRGIVDDFDGLRPTSADAEAVARLERSPGVEEQREARRRWARREAAWPTRIGDATARLRDASPPPRADQLEAELDLARLLAFAVDSPGSEASLAAQRMLSTLFTQASFYIFRDLYAAEQWGRAEIALEVAQRIAPADAAVLYNLACVRARAGKRKRALAALEAAIDAGYSDRAAIDRDPDLDSLRRLDGYRRIVERLEPAAATVDD